MFGDKVTSKMMLDILCSGKKEKDLEKIEEHFDSDISVPLETSTKIM